MISLCKIFVPYILFSLINYAHSSPDNQVIGRVLTELDITKKQITHNYIYDSINGLDVFNAMGLSAFKTVKEGDNVIWRNSNDQEYSTRVEVRDNKLTIVSNYQFWIYYKNERGIWAYSGNVDVSSPFTSTPDLNSISGQSANKEQREADLMEKLLKLENEFMLVKYEYNHFKVKLLSVYLLLGEVMEGMGL